MPPHALKSDSSIAPQPLTGLSREELQILVTDSGEPAYRADQILDWVYRKNVDSFSEMTNLGAPLRTALAEKLTVDQLELVRKQGSNDTTRKYLFRLKSDGKLIETVFIPASPALYGEVSDRRTICVSSQVGCAYNCKFCASGLAGFTRNLTAAEIVDQLRAVQRESGERISNIVFMGMGEPLANLTNLLRATGIINAEWGVGIGARHMTVSTSGLAPQIKKLADHPMQIRLAISLHGASDDVRDKIMPVNRKYNIERLFEALRYFRTKKKQRITFEYILIDNVNDHLDQARLLARHARSLSAKVNLIPYNTVDGLSWKRSPEHVCEQFLGVLRKANVPATLRREKGHDIDAACGQLRLKEESTLEN